MDNVMTKGFCELNENEMMDVDGGGNLFEDLGYAAGQGVHKYWNFMEDYGAYMHRTYFE